jgi:AcrR family transcriptional regulator
LNAVPHRKRLTAAVRREAILATAIDEFSKAGYDRTRVADIATRLKVTEPVIFQQFGSKAELFAAVVNRASSELSAHIEAIAGPHDDPLSALAQFLSPGHLAQMHSRGGIGVVFADATRRPARDPIRRAADRSLTRVAMAVAGLLRRGQDTGTVRQDVDATELAWLALSQIHAWSFRRSAGHAKTVALERGALEGVIGLMAASAR